MSALARASARLARGLAAAVLSVAACAVAMAQGAPAPSVQAHEWATQGRITYRVLRGENGLALGEARHQWEHDGRRYRMETVVETTGIAAVLYSFHYVQRSQGRVLANGGLQPERFTVERAGRAPEVAEFDWAGRQVVIRRKDKRREAALQAGDQDVLSLWHQIGRGLGDARTADLTVVSNKVAAPSVLEVLGRETVRLPLGRIEALRVKARAKDGSLALDIWLDERRNLLPVRILMTDDKGEVLDQQAVAVELGAPAPERKDK